MAEGAGGGKLLRWLRGLKGIGFMALWGFGAKCVTEWMEWMGDTP